MAIQIYQLGIDNGLTQSSVLSIAQDSLGRMWFGTEEGLNVYDGFKIETFQSNQEVFQENQRKKIFGNNIQKIVLSKKQELYFISDSRLLKYSLQSERFDFVSNTCLALDFDGENILFATYNGIYTVIDEKCKLFYEFEHSVNVTSINKVDNSIYVGTKSGVYVLDSSAKLISIIKNIDVFNTYIDSNKQLWIATRNNGVYRYSINSQEVNHWNVSQKKQNANQFLLSNDVRCFTEDELGNIWIGTFQGLSLFNTDKGEFVSCPVEKQHNGLSHESIYALYSDVQGNIWVGTYYGGVNYFQPYSNKFTYYSGEVNNNNSYQLNSTIIGDMVEDKDKNLWICTEGGGLNILSRDISKFKYLTPQWSVNNIQFWHRNLKAIVYDELKDKMYIGSYTGGLISYDMVTKKFKYFYLDYAEYPSKLGHQVDRLAIYNRSLIIQIKGGLYTLDLDDLENPKFEPLLNSRRYENYWIKSFFIDSKDNIWIAGFDYLSKRSLKDKSQFKKFYPSKYTYGKFSITSFTEDKEGSIYIGTRGSGVYKFDSKKDSFIHFSEQNGMLLSDYCYDLNVSTNGTVLVLGNKGLTFYDPKLNCSELFSLENNPKSISFNLGSKIYVSKDSTLFISGINGLIAFKENNIAENKDSNNIFFSKLLLGGAPVSALNHKDVIDKALPFSRIINLQPHQQEFKIYLGSNNYNSSKHFIYEYKLEGLDRKWSTISVPVITYTNLNYGKYRLLVRAKSSNYGSNNTSKEAFLDIIVEAPFYLTWWFKLLIISLLLMLLIGGVLFKLKQVKLESKLQLEIKERDKIEKWGRDKTNFFTAISHEFRTPLTLIISHIDYVLNHIDLPGKFKKDMKSIQVNADSLKELSSELILFEKAQQDALKINVSKNDIIEVIKNICDSFLVIAKSKSISLRLNAPNHPLFLWIDVKAFKKIITNLLSNALKFTEENGHVDLILIEDKDKVKIQIIDDGCGISLEEQNQIFEVFYRINNMSFKNGTGVGLPLAKRMVELHKGSIQVNSEVGYGTIFTVEFFKGYNHLLNEKLVVIDFNDVTSQLDYSVSQQFEPQLNLDAKKNDDKEYSILIVEDNREISVLLYNIFNDIYNVTLAANGKEGYELALKKKPDIILSDIIMPVMDGFMLCQKIKNNPNLSDIPVVLLSALSSEEEKEKAYTCKANAFITKPFSSSQLLLRCNNILNNYLALKSKFVHDKFNKGTSDTLITNNSEDAEFIAKIDRVIEENYSNEELDVDAIAELLYMSRSSFYDKFKTLKGISPSEYLRTYRMHKASLFLIEEPLLPVSEIAYKVGYSTPHYFSKSFKSLFKLSPSMYRKQKGI